jgi:Ca-activated chloride channel family protein
MTFIWPVMLLSLILIPLFVALFFWLQRRRNKIVSKYGSLGFMQGSAPGSPAPVGAPRVSGERSVKRVGMRRYVPPILFLAGLAILLIALARPQMMVRLPRVEGTVILAFDVSGSMAAEDLKPTRMEAAKIAAKDFVEHLPVSVQIGVVAFSENGFAVQPPTYEKDLILSTIDRLSPQRGTSLGNGILASLKTIETDFRQDGPLQLSEKTPEATATPTPVPQGFHQPAVIVLLTDGENNSSPNPFDAAQASLDRGVRIYTIGIGSAAGTELKVNGFTVFTQLDEEMLEQIAQLTGGVYYNAQNEQDLYSIYDNLDPQLVIKAEKMEMTSIFAGASIAILVVGGIISLLWFSRLP